MPKQTEHPFKLISRVIQSGDIPSVLLLYGKERFLIDWSCKAIKNKLVNPITESLDYTLFNESATEVSELIAACETVPFMSERKVVVVRDLALPLEEYVATVPKSAVLIIVEEKIDKRKALYKQVEKFGLAYDFYSLDEATLSSWIAKNYSSLNKSEALSFANAAGYFDKERNYSLYNLQGDLKKAVILGGFSEIGISETETNAFKLLDAAFSNRKAEALKLLQNEKEIFKFHGLLCSQLEIMLEARQRKEKHIPQNQSINSYRLQKAIAASEHLSTERLKAALAACYRIESDIKSGRMDQRLALELFIAKI